MHNERWFLWAPEIEIMSDYDSLLLNTPDDIWLRLIVSDCICLPLNRSDHIWLHLIATDYVWIHLFTFDHVWIRLITFDYVMGWVDGWVSGWEAWVAVSLKAKFIESRSINVWSCKNHKHTVTKSEGQTVRRSYRQTGIRTDGQTRSNGQTVRRSKIV